MIISNYKKKVIAKRKKLSSTSKEAIWGYVFILPVLLGLLIFTFSPMAVSLKLSFCKYNILSPPKYIGLGNYVKMFTRDPTFWQALKVTSIYVIFAIPLGLIFGLLLALMLNQKIKFMSWYRTVYYLPAVASGVGIFMLWVWIFNRDYGILNALLHKLGFNQLAKTAWLGDPKTALGALILMSLWGVGGGMLIYLAGLQGIPTRLYEVATLDGAGAWKKFFHITLPMITPTLFFNLVIGLIAAFQIFDQVYIMTDGGPMNATLFYVLKLYRTAFLYLRMGYASGLAWILFFIIMALTFLIFKLSPLWVYYEGEKKGK